MLQMIPLLQSYWRIEKPNIPSSWMKTWSFLLTCIIVGCSKLGDGAVKCQSVAKDMSPASYYRPIETANRYWLFQTLQRIKDAGLDEKWNEYYAWTLLMEEKVKARQLLDGGLGLIEMSKFTPVFVLWALVGLLANVVLFAELFLYSILEKLN